MAGACAEEEAEDPAAASPRPGAAGRAATHALPADDMGARQRAILYAVARLRRRRADRRDRLVVVGGGSSARTTRSQRRWPRPAASSRLTPSQPRTPHYTTLNPPTEAELEHVSRRRAASTIHQWVLWGVYTQPVNRVMVVHNQEHGGVIIQYGSKVPQSTIAQMTTSGRSDPTRDARRAAAEARQQDRARPRGRHWAGVHARSTRRRSRSSRSAFRYHGPESCVFPKSALRARPMSCRAA